MDIKEQYPLGAKSKEWADLSLFINKMDKAGSNIISVMAQQMPWVIDKDFSNPESFTDQEVWEYLEAISFE